MQNKILALHFELSSFRCKILPFGLISMWKFSSTCDVHVLMEIETYFLYKILETNFVVFKKTEYIYFNSDHTIYLIMIYRPL